VNQTSREASVKLGKGNIRNNIVVGIKKIKAIYIGMSFLVFFSGIVLYGILRDTNMVLYSFLPKPAFLNTIFVSVNADNILLSIVRFNLPDGLWYLTGLFIIRSIWLPNIKWMTIYFIIFSLFAFVLEASQYFNAIPGTFDVIDLFCCGVMAFVESLIYHFLVERNFK
jgi:hypothetical protein